MPMLSICILFKEDIVTETALTTIKSQKPLRYKLSLFFQYSFTPPPLLFSPCLSTLTLETPDSLRFLLI